MNGSGKRLNQEKAKKMYSKRNEQYCEKQLNTIMQLIEEAIEEDKHEVIYPFVLHDSVRTRLEGEGFDIKTGVACGSLVTVYYISW